MDNIITGAIGVAIFLAFTLGLAASISTIPFAIIVIVVCLMLVTDFFQSAKASLEEERQKKSNSPQ